jgi:hypothetical protein
MIQQKAWAGEFGQQYTDRNLLTPEDVKAAGLSYDGVGRR